MGRKLEEFRPADKNEVRLYTCGPTVYNNVHIGNLRAYIFGDIVKRALEFNGFDVNWVMNITDVDDKTIANTIKESGDSAGVTDLRKFTDRYFDTFIEDLKRVNINPEDISFVKVSDKIADIQEYIVALIKKGYAYKADDGSTYFSIEKYQNDFGDYGALVGPKFLAGKKIGARVKVDEYNKENLSDFALWKAYADDDAQIYWDHPVLGRGRPGWHIECTLINYSKFPNGTDIHTGGVDLIFPHHTNETAQAKPIYQPFVKYWLHSEHIQMNDQKMSKSLGNVWVLKDLEIEGVATGLSLRYLYLQSHYRSKVNVTKESLGAAKSGYENLVRQIGSLKTQISDAGPTSVKANAEYIAKFKNALNDDLNTAQAMALMQEVLGSSLTAEQKLATVLKMDEVLGLNLESAETEMNIFSDLPAELKELISKRQQAKQNKDYELSDKLRAEAEKMGYKLVDTAKGTEAYKL